MVREAREETGLGIRVQDPFLVVSRIDRTTLASVVEELGGALLSRDGLCEIGPKDGLSSQIGDSARMDEVFGKTAANASWYCAIGWALRTTSYLPLSGRPDRTIMAVLQHVSGPTSVSSGCSDGRVLWALRGRGCAQTQSRCAGCGWRCMSMESGLASVRARGERLGSESGPWTGDRQSITYPDPRDYARERVACQATVLR